MTSTISKLEALRDQLSGTMAKNFEGKVFLPDLTCRNIISAADIEGCLREAELGPATLRDEVVSAIQNGGQKLFAILALMQGNHVGLLVNFLSVDHLNTGTLDARLPFQLGQLMEMFGDPVQAASFYQTQWALTSPLFREDRSDRKFNNDTVLPFMTRTLKGSGVSGKVYEVVFHNSHHAFGFAAAHKEGQVRLACKELSTDDVSSEKEILILLRQLRHANMIQLLASYSMRGTRCLLFPLADMSLQTFMAPGDDAGHLIPQYFPSYEEYLDQVLGLSSALESLHNYMDATDGVRMKGCHFDLAPRNILLQKGKLLLADFGASRLRSESSDSATRFKGGAGDFLAPECTVVGFGSDVGGHLVGRKSDVWSFGGLLAVLVVLQASGRQGLAAFRAARRHEGLDLTTWRFHASGRENIQMWDWLKTCNFSPTQQATLGLARWMLTPTPNLRPAMSQATTYLRLVSQRARFRAIDAQFAKLLKARPALKLQIEQERFFCWSCAAGLHVERSEYSPPLELEGEEQQEASWLVKPKHRAEFHTISGILREMQEENSFLITGLDQDNPIAPIYDRLNDLNSKLWGLAPANERVRMLAQLEAAIDRILDARGMESRHVISNLSPSWERQALLLAAMRYMSKKLQDSRRLTPDLSVNPNQIRLAQKVGKANIVYVGNDAHQPLFCEWISYDIHMIDQVADPLVERVEAIARRFAFKPEERPADFNVLHCRGWYHDLPKSRFGLVFDFPPPLEVRLRGNRRPPVSLRELLKQQPRPSLERLFDLVQTLVKSIHYFHRANWVHKNISSHNVVFFPDEDDWSLGESGFPTPYLVGFNHSRPNNPKDFTKGPEGIDKSYMHPEYAQPPEPRFRLGYDYYSAGLLLLEIGLWEPISRSSLLLKKDIEKFTPAELQALWMERAVPLLGPLMGATYKKAVTLCLNDHFLAMSAVQSIEEFNQQVVQRLGHCCV
ncbi:kinase-like domain-containing protein [Podospora didyma]|uniref:Kinase-like domain-containing protein n=1 Tax=Podospora didyma TaxID=330526 RepID=A0AAE0NTF4_9PEZI|nr:kinase-like domain-containing protein [Podospora didyma]